MRQTDHGENGYPHLNHLWSMPIFPASLEGFRGECAALEGYPVLSTSCAGTSPAAKHFMWNLKKSGSRNIKVYIALVRGSSWYRNINDLGRRPQSIFHQTTKVAKLCRHDRPPLFV
jgi:hypothetical protein